MNFLLLCFLSLALGFLGGNYLKLPKKDSSRISWGILLLMLFSLGYGIGANKELLLMLNSLGAQAFILCIATIAGSLLAVKLYLLGRNPNDN